MQPNHNKRKKCTSCEWEMNATGFEKLNQCKITK